MKGYEYLIRACARLKEKRAFECHIVGDGHLRKDLEGLIAELGLQGHVILDGILDSVQVKALLDKTTVFVVPSVWDDRDGQDGIPLVLMEALAMGKPAVASRLSGIPELIVDGETGLLVEPGNVEELADKLDGLLGSEELRSRFVAKGRVKVEEEFDIVKNTRELVELF